MQIEYLDTYNKVGCLVDVDINEECTISDEDMNKLVTYYDENMSSIDYINDAVRLVLYNSWNLGEKLGVISEVKNDE